MADAPKYRWICHNCQRANEAGTDTCRACAASAHFRVKDLPPEEEAADSHYAAKSVVMADPMLFFPEIIPAAFVALVSPIWFVLLLLRGQFSSALLLAVGVGACTAGFIASARDKQKWLAYVCMMGVLVTAFLAQSAHTY